MIYGSVCSGIEAATAAWHPLGWEPAFFSEIEAFPRAVLQHHCPRVPLHGDFTTIRAGDYRPIDLLVGGTPCQDFSIAGLRAGMAGDRGNLTLQFLTLARRLRPQWLVWENVPGVLSSNGGRDFGAFLGGLGELGYGWAYRTLDAQFFGVPQRRRRVFVVGYLGDWRYPAAVLFERHSLQGHPAPRREARERVAPTISARPSGGGGLGTDFDLDGGLICPAISPALEARDYKGPSSDGDGDGDGAPLIAHALRASGFDASEDGTGRGTPSAPMAFSCKDHGADAGELSPTLRSMGHDGSHANAGGQVAVAFACIKGAAIGRKPENGPQYGDYLDDGTSYTLNCTEQHAVAFHENQRDELTESATAGSLTTGGGKPGQGYPAIMERSAVRRLTPRECERLQGFPDDYTLVPHRGKPAADGPRYKALGNSMAVPVMAWIGERIALVASLKSEQVAA